MSPSPPPDYAADPLAHEQSCLHQALQVVADPDFERVVHGAWLEGRFPETVLIIDASKARDPRLRIRMPWAIWELGSFPNLPPGRPHTLSPQEVGDDIHMHLREFAFT
jgi:hypothetical protein